MSAVPSRAGGGRGWLVAAFSIPMLALLLALGTWQVQRLNWKEALLARIDERIAAEPVPIDAIAALDAQGQGIAYRPIRLEGAFVHAAEQHYLATWQGQSGFFVHTPLKLSNGRHVFVNRGFVPYDRKDKDTRAEGQLEGRVEIEGLVRAAPQDKPSFIVPRNDPAENIYYWKDLSAMARAAGLSTEDIYPFYVDADETRNPGGLPVGGVTRISLPNNHLQYAVTWYSLACALILVLVVWFRRHRTGDDGKA